MTAFERRLAGAPSSIRADLVAEFWATHRPTPLVEPVPQPPADARGPGPVAPGAGQAAPREVIVTFLWRDAGPTEVLMFANRLTDERGLAASLMAQVTGTDIWHLSYRLGSDWRASYGFVPRLPDAPWPWAHDAARAEPVGAAGIEPVDQVALRRALDQCLPDPTNPARNRNRAGWAQSVVA
ncbi:MAG: DUF3327 domain-containing protein, partial [Bifidobacteriaceae bacterium]|nr:DUF3327 domain-containing protein [Bifidobacteriaceae bacterium]